MLKESREQLGQPRGWGRVVSSLIKQVLSTARAGSSASRWQCPSHSKVLFVAVPWAGSCRPDMRLGQSCRVSHGHVLWQDVGDVVPGVPVQTLLQPLLVQVVACNGGVGVTQLLLLPSLPQGSLRGRKRLMERAQRRPQG